MWQDNPVTAYIVLGLGNLLGGVTKGLTGFGSAIAGLCTWIVCVVAELESGTLQQAVICEALSSTLIAPGLLYATRAHATADFRTVTAISLFVALSSPLGAAILAKLDSKRVELVMATALLLIIVAEQVSKLVHSRCRRQHGSSSRQAPALRRQQQQRRHQEEAYGIAAAAAAAADATGASLTCRCSNTPSGLCVEIGESPPQLSPLAPLLDSEDAAAAAADAADCTMFLPEGGNASSSSSSLAKHSGNRRDSAKDLYAEAVVTFADVPAPCQDQGPKQALEDAEHQPLLSGTGSGSASGRPAAVEGSSGSGSGSLSDNNTNSNRQHSRWCEAAKAWCIVLGIGSIAGTLSGIMEGLTGMNGPPIMIMYRRLNTPKATVRGNNAFLNLLQMRLVPYWYMGLIVKRDIQLYVVTCAAGAVGVVLGDRLSYCIDQQAFQKVLGVLMALCCALMFASGLGFVE